MGALILNHTLRKERLIRPVTHALSKNCAKFFQQQLRIQYNPLQRALRAFWPKAGQKTIIQGHRTSDYRNTQLHIHAGAPKSAGGNTPAHFLRNKSATRQCNPQAAQRAQD
jgi:hypothetical protein